MTTERAADLALAQRAALIGARLGLQYFQRVKDLRVDYKSDGSYVTEADCRVEETVRSVLLADRPNDACLGEETGEIGAGPRRWILDGIDGTAVFLRGEPSWQTLIALEEDGVVTVAVASVPAQGKLWWAARGEGAHVGTIHDGQLRDAQSIRVNPEPAGLEGRLIGIVPDYAQLAPGYRAMVDDVLKVTRLTPCAVHAGLLVASGELDVAVQLAGKIWDYAAPSLIVEEAGGAFSGADSDGHPVFGNAVYARNPAIHTAALALLRS